MFLKLWKYEIKCSYRAYLLMYAILLLSTLFVNASIPMLSVISMVIYGCMIVVILVMTFVMIIRTYQQSMFSKNGYLTLTLPVSGKMLMTVKIMNATMWFLLSYVIIFLSVMVLSMRMGEISITELMDAFGYVFQRADLESWMMLINLTVSMLQTVTMMYMIMNFTHTNYIRKHRGLIAVVIFVVLNLLLSTVNGFLFTDGASLSMMDLFIGSTSTGGGFIENSVYVSTIESMVLLILCFFGASYILDHKLEIE